MSVQEITTYLISLIHIFHSRSDSLRRPRQSSFVPQNDELQFGEDLLDSATSSSSKKSSSSGSSEKKSASASEQIQVRLEFPGNEYSRPKRSNLAKGEEDVLK